MNESGRPMFTIGVTTYRRGEMIRETLDSIAAQTFRDFEAIIGNDYVGEKLTAAGLGVAADPRFRVVNHPENLGEIGNMNALLSQARGKYFAWIADDDRYAPEFLEAVAKGFRDNPGVECAYTGFDVFTGSEEREPSATASRVSEGIPGSVYPGPEFARSLLSGGFKVIGTYGVFPATSLREMGGVAKLSDSGFALFSEYLLILQCGLKERVFHDPRPLVHYRFHPESWGCSNIEIENYRAAAETLLARGVGILADPRLRSDFRGNLSALLKLAIGYFVSKVSMAEGRCSAVRAVASMLRRVDAEISRVGDAWLVSEGRAALRTAAGALAWPLFKAKVKSVLPTSVLRKIKPPC